MIEKKIHYCWYGRGEMSALHQRCIESWSKFLPDYEIILWDETNTDFDNEFLIECRKNKQWAFISDFIRLRVMFEYGGIYFDADIEVIKSFDDLLVNDCFLGYESKGRLNTGVMGSIPNHWFHRKCMDFMLSNYNSNNPYYIAPEVATKCFYSDSRSIEIKDFAEDYFYPYNPYDASKKTSNLMFSDITENTYAIHHWAKGWNQTLPVKFMKKFKSLIKSFNL
jgi:mannosyltransferase OCH1-like enzyme